MSAAVLAVLTGCGGEGGVAEDASVSVYVVSPLCAGAEEELAMHGAEAGDVRVRVSCLPSAESSQKLDLAQIGANARRATEDSSSVAYIGEPTRAATRFSAPILEAAEIPQYAGISGAEAMEKLLMDLEEGRLSPRGNL